MPPPICTRRSLPRFRARGASSADGCARSGARLEPRERSNHGLGVDLVDLDARPIARRSVTVSSPPRCSRNSRRPASSAGFSSASSRPSASCQSGSRAPRAARRRARAPASGSRPVSHAVAAVERHADRDRFAVAQLVAAERLELVRGPVAEVERARAAELERIAARSRCGAGAARRTLRISCSTCGSLKAAERGALRLEPREESRDRGSARP